MSRIRGIESGSEHPVSISAPLPLILLVSTVLLALSLDRPAEAKRTRHAETTTVTATGGPAAFLWQWSPVDVTIAKGDRVLWENPTSTAHGIEVWDGPSFFVGDLPTGKRVVLKFKKVGVYAYRCPIAPHSDIVYYGTERTCVGMCGTITVE